MPLPQEGNLASNERIHSILPMNSARYIQIVCATWMLNFNILVFVFLSVKCSYCDLDKKQQQIFMSKPNHMDPISIKEKFIQAKVRQ